MNKLIKCASPTTYLATVFCFAQLMLIACSLDHYEHQKTVKIRSMFPANDSNSSSLNKPADTGSDYIPSFVDKIVLTVQGGSSNTTVFTNEREDDYLSNEFDVGDLTYGDTYSFSVEAFSENIRNSSENQEILTHNGTLNSQTLSLGTESIELSINLEVQSGNTGILLDEEALGIDVAGGITFSINPYPSLNYCSGMDPDGNFILAWVKETLIPMGGKYYIVKARKFDPHGNVLPFQNKLQYSGGQTFEVIYGTSDNEIKLVNSCPYFNGKFLIPFIEKTDTTTWDLKLALFDGTEDIPVSSIAERATTNISNGLPHLDANSNFFVFIWQDGAGNVLVRAYDQDINVTDELTFSNETYLNPKAKVIDDDKFLVYMVRPNSPPAITGKIIGRSNEDFKNLSPYFSYATNAIHSIAFTESGFQLLYSVFDIPSMEGDIFSTMLDSNLEGLSAVTFLSEELNIETQALPYIANYRGTGRVVVWTDNRNNAIYNIFYSVLSDTGSAQGVTALTNYYDFHAGEPRVAANDDGLGIISWFYIENAYFYIKRFLF